MNDVVFNPDEELPKEITSRTYPTRTISKRCSSCGSKNTFEFHLHNNYPFYVKCVNCKNKGIVVLHAIEPSDEFTE